jgi:hypothetical protein
MIASLSPTAERAKLPKKTLTKIIDSYSFPGTSANENESVWQ